MVVEVEVELGKKGSCPYSKGGGTPFFSNFNGVMIIFSIFRWHTYHFQVFSGGQCLLYNFRGVMKKFTKTVRKRLNIPIIKGGQANF